MDRNGRTIFVADAHRGDGNRFIVDRVSGIGNGDLYLPVEPPGAVDGKLTAICVRGRTACRDLEQEAGIVLRSVIELRCGSLELTPRN